MIRPSCSVHHTRRTGSTEATVVVTLACIVVLAGAWLLVGGDLSPAPGERNVAESAATAPAPATLATHSTTEIVDLDPIEAEPALGATEAALALPRVESLSESPEIATAEPRSVETQATESQTSESQASRRERVAAHLATGEFGPALDIANGVAQADEKAVLLGMIAHAQTDVGEFRTALAAIKRMPVSEEKREVHRREVSEQALAGGGPQADFDSLINLIQQETSGPWFDIEGFGGTVSPYETGVRVDPNGQIHRLTQQERTNRLRDLGIQARVADLNEDMARPSKLRLVSLTRLERAVRDRLEAGKPVVETMRHLAGLSRIEYVFVYPEQKEIVIGGPAEGWRFDERGTPVGVTTGQPTMQLDDLVTVLRIFAPEGNKLFICAIVPRKDNMRQVQEYVAESNRRGALSPAAVRGFTRRIEQLMGAQDVDFTGVPVDSRVASVILEADYRMKLIGIDKLDRGPNMKSFFDLLSNAEARQAPPANAMRWWLTMKYDALRHSADRNVFAIEGSSVLCRSEDEIVTAQGDRVHTGQADGANRAFAANFTQHYAELAQRDPVFADLQNIFDLSLVAALIQEEGLDERSGWDLGCFAPGGEFQPTTYPVPKTVPSVVNHRLYNGKNIVVQAAGGVRGDLMTVVTDEEIARETPQLGRMTQQAEAPELPAGRWWWDAAKTVE